MRRPAVLAALFLTLSCSSSDKMECQGSVVDGKCVPCEGTWTGEQCIPDQEVKEGKACEEDKECLPSAVCIKGHCGTECFYDSQCDEGEVCHTYRCKVQGAVEGVETANPPDVGPTEVVEVVEVVDVIDVAEHAQGEPDAAQDPGGPELGPGCDPTDGPYAAACSCEQECASGLCVLNKVINAGMCTQYCTSDAQCPGPDVCVPLEDVAICFTNDSGQITSCDPNQAICFKQLFLTNKLGQCACTTPCVKAADCPEGFACHVLGVQKVCVSVGEVCQTGYIPCFGECAGDPNTGQGFCTALCVSSADCPAGWTCGAIPEGKVCQPE